MKKNKHLYRERDTVSKMILLFCRSQHKNHSGQLCKDCQKLEFYAHQRIEHCPFASSKPTCVKCPVHCYRPEQREQIRKVMRYAGPRMLLNHPIMAIRHLTQGLRKPPLH